MGRVILCMGNVAKTPYLIRKADISVYTVEELCYCIRENTFLMDEDMVCRELVDWLRQECGLSELADSLRGYLRGRPSVSSFLTEIMEYAGFYPREEIRRIRQFLEAEAGQSEYERQKNAADYLAGNGKYELAMMRYHELLQDIPQEEILLRARIVHNMGYVSSQLFLFDRAAKFFYNAYELSGEGESFLQFLAARRMQLDEKSYVDFIAGLSEDCYGITMELEKRVEQVAQEWQQSGQAKELGWLEEQSGDGHCLELLEDAAGQMKEKYRSMIREK